MATTKAGTYLLFLAITLWGTLLGGIAYSHLVYFPVYLSALPDSAVVVNGPYGLDEARFWITIHPLLVVTLVAAVAMNWRAEARRRLILYSSVVYIVVLVVSALYFIPELRAFQRSAESGIAAAEWLARGERWQRMSWVRGAVCYAAFLPLLVALTKPAAMLKDEEKGLAS